MQLTPQFLLLFSTSFVVVRSLPLVAREPSRLVRREGSSLHTRFPPISNDPFMDKGGRFRRNFL